jgi:hypothetical protein
LSESRTDGRRGIRLACRTLQLDVCLNLFSH